ncbi:TPA: DUF1642 domain-containing protein [Streptococcus suis]|nr:DUF1642 domain-containing protein [Streptococcus suis]
MNKQEAIEKIKNISTLNINDAIVGQQVDMVIKNQVLDLVSQIHEPQKVVVPKFVALHIEKYKDSNKSLHQLLDLSDDKEFNDWFLPNGEVDASRCDVLARAWLDGYEIEQEKLYTVEIADAILTKITTGNNVQYKFLNFADVSEVSERTIYTAKLTEQEIKQKDERLWQFAKEVE